MIPEGIPQPHNSEAKWHALFEQPPIIPSHINNLYGHLEEKLAQRSHIKAFDRASYKEVTHLKATEAILMRLSQEFFLGRHLRDIQTPNMFIDVTSESEMSRENIVFEMESSHLIAVYEAYEDLAMDKLVHMEAKIARRRARHR